MLQVTDLAASEDTISESAVVFVETALEGGDDEAQNIVLILGQLDPMEKVDGQPRWSAQQILLMEKAREHLSEWEQEDSVEASEDSSDSDEPKSDVGDESAFESTAQPEVLINPDGSGYQV